MIGRPLLPGVRDSGGTREWLAEIYTEETNVRADVKNKRELDEYLC